MELGVGPHRRFQFPDRGEASEVDVTSRREFPQSYEFRGRIEDFPLPDRSYAGESFPGCCCERRISMMTAPPSRRSETRLPASGEEEGQDQKSWVIDEHLPTVEIESVEGVEARSYESWPPKNVTPPSRFRRSWRRVIGRGLRGGRCCSSSCSARSGRPGGAARSQILPRAARTDQVRPAVDSFENERFAIRSAMVLISPNFRFISSNRAPAGRSDR